MTNKHTPAPWNILGYDEIEALPVIEVCAGLIGSESFVSVVYVNGDIDDGITAATKANAQLIAAAPELLAALQDILERFESCIEDGNGELDDDAVAVKTARAAINKAEGK